MTTVEPAPFGALLRYHRAKAGLTQEQLAAREARERYRALADVLRGQYAEPPRHRTEGASARLLWSGTPPPNVATYRSMEVVGLIGVCIGEINRGDPQKGIQAGCEALRLLEEATNAQVRALGCLCLAHGLTEVWRYEEALAVARRGLEAAQISGDLYSMVATRCALAHALHAVGSIEEAADFLREALAIAERIPVTYWSLRPLAYLCANRA